jgi:pimeloyl-ACP methyl ester carboxylesterase
VTTRVVLLPGLDGTGLLFRPLLSALGDGIAATPVAYPGDRALGYAELLPLVLEAIPADGPFVLLGESFSGPLAVLAAERLSAGQTQGAGGLRGVILCATFLRSPHPYVPAALSRNVPEAPFRLFPFFAQAKALLGGYASGGLLSLLREAHGSVAPAVFARRLREVALVDVREELRRVRAPVLYLRGTRDVVVPYWNAREVVRLRPDARIERIRAPHLVLQTRPEPSAGAIHRFVNETAAPAGR